MPADPREIVGGAAGYMTVGEKHIRPFRMAEVNFIETAIALNDWVRRQTPRLVHDHPLAVVVRCANPYSSTNISKVADAPG